MKYYLKQMRIKHYIKNTLMFAPIFFSGKLLNINASILFNLFAIFISFSLIASSVYVINDLKDLEKDKLHPKKRFRPIASGKISTKQATIFLFILFSLSVAIAGFISYNLNNYRILMIILIYFIINVTYSIFHLKDIPLIDVAIIALGFFLRLHIGGQVAMVINSSWIYLVVISGSFYLGFGKRKGELEKVGLNTRASLKEYNLEFLNLSMNACMTLAITFFALWCKERQALENNEFYLILVPFMMLIFFKYNLNLKNEKFDGDPVGTILEDKVLLSLVLIMILLFFSVVYMR